MSQSRNINSELDAPQAPLPALIHKMRTSLLFRSEPEVQGWAEELESIILSDPYEVKKLRTAQLHTEIRWALDEGREFRHFVEMLKDLEDGRD